MGDKLNLTLPERNSGHGRPPKTVIILLGFLLLLGMANLFILLNGLPGGTNGRPENGLSPENLKEIALRLEKQDIGDGAVQIWQEYLAQAEPTREEQAKIWYRIGKILQNDGKYEPALAALYRSEHLAKIPELTPEINRRVQESLESLGKFAALRYELADRVGIDDGSGKNAGGRVLAEIGGHKITQSELDERIEGLIDGQLAQFASFLSTEERKARKESLLKQLSTTTERQQLLNQMVVEEMLYRKAGEDKLNENPSVRKMVQQAERSVLAQQVMTKELADKINITEGDLQTYYQAHQQEYTDPEQARISHILVKDRAGADLVLQKLKEGRDFEELVKDYSQDKATRDREGKIDSWVRKGEVVPAIGKAENIERIIFNTGAGQVADKAVTSDKGFHIIKVREKREKRQQSFAEARQEIWRAIWSRKESEIRQALMENLKERYNVVIHLSGLHEEAGETTQENMAPKNKTAGAGS